MSLARSGLHLVGFILAAVILGALLGGAVDMVLPGLTAGTALGPKAHASPFVWTVIGGAIIYAFNEVRD